MNKFALQASLLMMLLSVPGPPVHARDYLWPTNASTYMSASFCEFRVGHYHSAIDIKTWLQEGYKCFAVDDGEITRIRVSPFGYGKVLYLRLKDGNTAVYAHLQRFSPELEALVREKQLANKRYTLNWSPGGLKVKKGDVIAYTGRTGIGLPHLHFEIRNTRGNPVNPLAFYDDIKDDIRPTPQQLAVIPLEPGATVNNSYLPRIFDLERLSTGRYRVNGGIHISGRAGLALSGIDRANDVGNKYGFYRTRLQIERQTVFEITYDELDFATTEHIFTELYYPLWVEQRDRFHKLYVEPFNPLPFYTRFPGHDGTVVPGDSAIAFTIEVSDFHGNRSTIDGRLDFDRPVIRTHKYERDGRWALLEFQSPSFSELTLHSGPLPDQLKPVAYFEVTGGRLHRPEEGLRLKIDLEDSTGHFLKMRLRTADSREAAALIAPAPPDTVSPKLHFRGDHMVVEIDDPAFPLHLHARSQRIAFHPTDDGHSQAVVPDTYADNNPVTLSIEANGHSFWRDTLTIARLMPESGQVISWLDSAFTIVSEPGTVIQPLLVSVRRSAPAILADSLPTASSIYEVFPESVLLFKQMDAYLRTDSLSDEGAWGLFRVSDSGKLSYSGAVEKTAGQKVRTRIGSPGRFVIACDTIPPELVIASPKNGTEYRKWPAVRFHLDDRHSGIGDEENIRILLDGAYILPEWDPEDDLVEAVIPYPLSKGTHTLTVSVSDRSQNTTREALIFTIR